MQHIIASVQKKFVITIVIVVVSVVVFGWLSLQLYNQRELAAPSSSAEIHETAKNDEALSAYIQQQHAYEAHFINLASDIKEQESDRVTRALAISAVVSISIGTLGAVVVSKFLVKPVKEAYSSQERFIQDAAHELRNPLAVLTVALQQADKQTQKTVLYKTFRRQTKRLIGINEDLLFLEKAGLGSAGLVNASDLLLDIIEELQPLASSRNIQMNVFTDEDLHVRILPSDYVRLLKNVVDNAVKYSPDGSNVAIKQTQHKHAVLITVKDKGIGIPSEEVQRIGSRFFRASNTGKVDGTGLGLAIVKKILATYKGSITIDSQLGKGTTVSISLPT